MFENNRKQKLKIAQTLNAQEIQSALNELHQIRTSGDISLDKANIKNYDNKIIVQYSEPGEGPYDNELSIMYSDIIKGYAFKVLGPNTYQIIERVIGLNNIYRCPRNCPIYHAY